jgi:glutamate-1-semialdehyde 2,1-aminomutase
MPFFRISGAAGRETLKSWVAECGRQGAYFLDYHNNFVSAAHGDTEVEETLAIAEGAFEAIAVTTA